MINMSTLPDKIKKYYTCEACKEVYEYRWSDEEANKEAEELFGVKDASCDKDMAIVCDDCFIKMRKQGLF